MIAKLGDDLAEMSLALARRGDDFAWGKLREFGEALCTLGGGDLMRKVWSRAIDRHGLGAVDGVADTWLGITGWVSCDG